MGVSWQKVSPCNSRNIPSKQTKGGIEGVPLDSHDLRGFFEKKCGNFFSILVSPQLFAGLMLVVFFLEKTISFQKRDFCWRLFNLSVGVIQQVRYC